MDALLLVAVAAGGSEAVLALAVVAVAVLALGAAVAVLLACDRGTRVDIRVLILHTVNFNRLPFPYPQWTCPFSHLQ